jgi:predicted RNA-binding Zn-ribbon protein involved in translation (DUF1610 family)
VFNKAAMTRHLKGCLDSPAAKPGKPNKWVARNSFHLLVEGRYAREYWLHLDVPAAVTLAKLDEFLRHIWLECCGHMSAFTIGEVRYSVALLPDPFSDESDELDMNRKLKEVLSPGTTFTHEYDFGTTTELKLKVLSQGIRAGTSSEVRILARNEPPPIKCESCGKDATQVCSQCLWDSAAWFCDKCAKKHKCGEEMLLPAANSPRVGMCGYCG